MGAERQHAPRAKRSGWLKAIGESFRRIREAQGVEQDQLPSPRPTVSRFENGDGVHLGLLETWCRAMGVEPSEVFGTYLDRSIEEDIATADRVVVPKGVLEMLPGENQQILFVMLKRMSEEEAGACIDFLKNRRRGLHSHERARSPGIQVK